MSVYQPTPVQAVVYRLPHPSQAVGNEAAWWREVSSVIAVALEQARSDGQRTGEALAYSAARTLLSTALAGLPGEGE